MVSCSRYVVEDTAVVDGCRFSRSGGAIVVTSVNCGGAKLVITTGVDTAAFNIVLVITAAINSVVTTTMVVFAAAVNTAMVTLVVLITGVATDRHAEYHSTD